MQTLRIGALLLLALVTACSDGGSPPASDPPGPGDTLRMNEAWLAGTHNSYWVDRGVSTDLFSSGVQESLLDQIVADGARPTELDVHPDPRNAKSDAATMLSLNDVEPLLAECVKIFQIVRSK